MLKHIYIQNYALIDSLEIDFYEGYSAVTGETGAGKSILLGALSLILGNRADTNVLKDKEEKCVVEAQFDIQRFSLKVFYDENDIDYDELTVIRREILPNGRTRAFINDTPVNVNVLKDLGVQLTDIHSQHQNLNLNNRQFQLRVLDAFSKLDTDLSDYRIIFGSYKSTKNDLYELIGKAENEKKELEYIQFQFNELADAKLKEDEQEALEAEYEELLHAEEIKQNLSYIFELLSQEESGINVRLKDSLNALKTIREYYKKTQEYIQRIESVKIETEDLAAEIERISEDIEYDPERAQFLKDRLDLLYSLQNKHNVTSVNELINIRNELDIKLNEITSYEEKINATQEKLDKLKKELSDKANKISSIRKDNIKNLENEITNVLVKLAMPNARFIVKLETEDDFCEHGIDIVSFLFSANKNIPPEEISDIASGGEISRLMLSIKSVISDSLALPAIIFDEIDTGVSGEVAEKIGIIMKEMSEDMQVINITHLPQVAAKADHHYKVFKVEDEKTTSTKIKELNYEGRKNELASMLSGEIITDAALKNAEELLNS